MLQVVDLVQTLDGGRRNMYDPDEIEEEQREREKRNKINADFKQFTTRVQVRPGHMNNTRCMLTHAPALLSHCAAAGSQHVRDFPERATAGLWSVKALPFVLRSACWSLRAAQADTFGVVAQAPTAVLLCVQEHWEKEMPDLQLEWDVPFRWEAADTCSFTSSFLCALYLTLPCTTLAFLGSAQRTSWSSIADTADLPTCHQLTHPHKPSLCLLAQGAWVRRCAVP